MIWIKPLAWLVLPPIIALCLLRHRRFARWIFGTGWLIVMLVSCYPLAYALSLQDFGNDEVKIASVSPVPEGKIGDIYAGQKWEVTDSTLHGLSGWQGVDIKSGCGASIYAPFDGQVTYNGLDGYNHVANGSAYEQSTMLTMQGDDGSEVTLLHGDFIRGLSHITQGQLVGYEASNGWSTGCHSHVIASMQGRKVNYLDYVALPLITTWYNPSLGGINCAAPCNMFADGTQVRDYFGESDEVSLACPAGWLGREITIPNLLTGICRDRGGAIKFAWNEIHNRMVIHVDVLSRSALDCNLCIYEDWSYRKN